MKNAVMSIFTRTPMHIGAGSSVGIVDLPIIRERHTGYPVIPGSSLKGVLADLWRDELERIKERLVRKTDSDLEKLFGVDNDPKRAATGNLLVGESRIVAFPVRSAKGGFAWTTCPLALGRFFRDASINVASIPKLAETESAAPANLRFDKQSIILEEYCIKATSDVPEEIVAALAGLSDDPLWQSELKAHLVILSDEMFKYFVESTCEIAQHVKISDVTGTAEGGGLFSQENVPAESMFYTLFHELKDGCIKALSDKLKTENNLIQVGADATTGLGWCSVSFSVDNK